MCSRVIKIRMSSAFEQQGDKIKKLLTVVQQCADTDQAVIYNRVCVFISVMRNNKGPTFVGLSVVSFLKAPLLTENLIIIKAKIHNGLGQTSGLFAVSWGLFRCFRGHWL